MEQKEQKTLGRPRKFSEEIVLRKALAIFRRSGFDAVTMDELAAEMGMNKPSIYRSFGDKSAIYTRAAILYTSDIKKIFFNSLKSGSDLHEALQNVFETAAKFFSENGHSASGCLILTTMPAAAGKNDAIRKQLSEFLIFSDQAVRATLQEKFAPCIERTPYSADALARFINATIHSLAIRARSGASQQELNLSANSMLSLIDLETKQL